MHCHLLIFLRLRKFQVQTFEFIKKLFVPCDLRSQAIIFFSFRLSKMLQFILKIFKPSQKFTSLVILGFSHLLESLSKFLLDLLEDHFLLSKFTLHLL
jgi:hypothetical protein